MAHAQAERGGASQRNPDIAAFGGIGVVIVRTVSVGVELLAEEVVVEAAARAGESAVTMRGAEVAAIGAEQQLGARRGSGGAEELNDARHGARAIERTGRAAHHLDAIHLEERYHAEVEES